MKRKKEKEGEPDRKDRAHCAAPLPPFRLRKKRRGRAGPAQEFGQNNFRPSSSTVDGGKGRRKGKTTSIAEMTRLGV